MVLDIGYCPSLLVGWILAIALLISSFGSSGVIFWDVVFHFSDMILFVVTSYAD